MKSGKTALGYLLLLVLLAGTVDARQSSGERDAGEGTHHSSSISQDDALALYSPAQQQLSFDACLDQFPKGKPFDLKRVKPDLKPLALCSDNFAVLYSQTTKTPLFSLERLTASQIANAKGEERTNQFYADPRLPRDGRAELSDYHEQSPAVDRGHQAPAGDAPTPKAMAQSFALSNMVPQDPTNNRKIWSKVEADVRKYVQRAGGNVFVFTGPLFDAGHGVIGKNQVWKPTRLFKLVYDESSGRAWAYILPNTETPIVPPVDYATFEHETGLHLLSGLTITGTISQP